MGSVRVKLCSFMGMIKVKNLQFIFRVNCRMVPRFPASLYSQTHLKIYYNWRLKFCNRVILSENLNFLTNFCLIFKKRRRYPSLSLSFIPINIKTVHTTTEAIATSKFIIEVAWQKERWMEERKMMKVVERVFLSFQKYRSKSGKKSQF